MTLAHRQYLYPFLFGILCIGNNATAWLTTQKSASYRLPAPTPRTNVVGLAKREQPNLTSARIRRVRVRQELRINMSSVDDAGTKKHQQQRTNKIRSLIQSLLRHIRRFLWPGLTKNFDPSLSAPLPKMVPSLGCPFFGNNILAGSKTKGPEYFYSKASAKLGHPRIWRFYFMGTPVTTVSGSANVNAVLQSKKFNIVPLDRSTENPNKSETKKKRRKEAKALFSSKSVMFEKDRGRHQFLRRLIGAAFMPSAVEEGMQNIVQAATEQLSKLENDSNNNDHGEAPKLLEDMCDNFAADIAWRQIIGLELQENEKEIRRFQKAVKAYVSGVFSISAYLNLPWKELLPPFRARAYLVEKVEERIAHLEKHGADNGITTTTLSAMVHSSDEDSKKKLTHEEIVENALILLIAGTETTSSTIMSAISFLGLHPHIFEKLKQEQQQLIHIHGNKISNDFLDKCTYLEAVISETMRIVPISGVNFRHSEETMVIDGKQIPKGEAVFCNIRLTHELDPNITSSSSSGTSMDPITNFVPERWLDPGTKPKEDFMPFGMGSRRCLGASLAMTELRVFLSIFARQVDAFELVGGGFEKNQIRWNPASLVPKPVGSVAIKSTSSNNVK